MVTSLATVEVSAPIDYGPLAGVLADPAITEIMVNGHREIWVERAGHLLLTTGSSPTSSGWSPASR